MRVTCVTLLLPIVLMSMLPIVLISMLPVVLISGIVPAANKHCGKMRQGCRRVAATATVLFPLSWDPRPSHRMRQTLPAGVAVSCRVHIGLGHRPSQVRTQSQSMLRNRAGAHYTLEARGPFLGWMSRLWCDARFVGCWPLTVQCDDANVVRHRMAPRHFRF